MKLFINPTFTKPDKGDGGIRRVVEAMVKYLPDHGITIVDSEPEADILNYHAGSFTPYKNKPMIASCHGLYWSNYKWPDYYHGANRSVINVMAMAQAVTAPSNWVNNAIARGILHKPHTVYHGINVNEWTPHPTPKNYVLWNKARADIISNPDDLTKIAAIMPATNFVTTIGKRTTNTAVIGVKTYNEMKLFIERAGVYLATARETFGIGTLEALAAGVPVAGWDFGGQSEIIQNGITGYLAPYGDYKALANCITKCMDNRAEMGKNARADAINQWQWPDKISQYAEIFWNVYNEWYKPRPKYTIIIPAYNLGQYLPQAVDSVTEQTDQDFECIIIDDNSTDNTAEIAREYTENDQRIRYIKTAKNAGLCNVRNIGYQQANGRYILYLDADDKIEPYALETLGGFLDNNPGAHIAYGRLDLMDETGQNRKAGGAVDNYDWLKQIAHDHRFPIGAALIRKEALTRSGGFRVRDWRAEDAAWIARVTSFGIRAYKATDKPILIYRLRRDSKSQKEAQKYSDIDGNWLAWLPWRIADTKKEGVKALQDDKRPPWYIVPFSAQHTPENPPHFNTDHHQDPIISIIVPVGPGHQAHLMDTIDSVTAQNVPFWELIIVNDTGQPLDLDWAPFTKVINTEGKRGAGYARNAGAKIARGPLLYFLDADDFLLTNALNTMLKAYTEQGGDRYIYTDYIDLQNNGRVKIQKMKAYNQAEWRCQHAVNILINKDHFFAVGGYDEDLPGWEDWDLPLKLAIAGYCGHHVRAETFVYRIYSGKRRTTAVNAQGDLLKTLHQRYSAYYNGGSKKMAKCCNGSTGAENILKVKAAYGDATAALALSIPEVKKVDSIRMEYTGSGKATFTRVSGKALTRQYIGAPNNSQRFINAHPSDAAPLELTGKWRRVQRPPAAANIPAIPKLSSNIEPAPPPPVEVVTDFDEPFTPAPDITTAALKLAKKHDIDIYLLKGSGKNGKITIADVKGVI